MFRQATVEDISKNRITKRHGKIFVVTRFYPRFLKSEMITEYLGTLAPQKSLLEEFKHKEREIGDHDRAFEEVDYENKFRLEEAAFLKLQELSRIAETETVFLVCHCKVGQYCHREILMLLAQREFGAKVAKSHHTYETLLKRDRAELTLPP